MIVAALTVSKSFSLHHIIHNKWFAASPRATLIPNIQVLGLDPYRGGVVTIHIRLFAVQSSVIAKPYLDSLHTLSQTEGVTFINAAMPFIRPIKAEAKQLLGSGKQSTFLAGLIAGYSPVNTIFRSISESKACSSPLIVRARSTARCPGIHPCKPLNAPWETCIAVEST